MTTCLSPLAVRLRGGRSIFDALADGDVLAWIVAIIIVLLLVGLGIIKAVKGKLRD